MLALGLRVEDAQHALGIRHDDGIAALRDDALQQGPLVLGLGPGGALALQQGRALLLRLPALLVPAVLGVGDGIPHGEVQPAVQGPLLGDDEHAAGLLQQPEDAVAHDAVLADDLRDVVAERLPLGPVHPGRLAHLAANRGRRLPAEGGVQEHRTAHRAVAGACRG